MAPVPRHAEAGKAGKAEQGKAGKAEQGKAAKSEQGKAGKSDLAKLNKSTNFFSYTALNSRSSSTRARNRHGPPNHWGSSIRRSRSVAGSLMEDHPLSHLQRPPAQEFLGSGAMTSHGDNSRVRVFYRTSGESSMRLLEPRFEKPNGQPASMWLSPQGGGPARPWVEYARDAPRGCIIQSTGDCSRGHE